MWIWFATSKMPKIRDLRCLKASNFKKFLGLRLGGLQRLRPPSLIFRPLRGFVGNGRKITPPPPPHTHTHTHTLILATARRWFDHSDYVACGWPQWLSSAWMATVIKFRVDGHSDYVACGWPQWLSCVCMATVIKFRVDKAWVTMT